MRGRGAGAGRRGRGQGGVHDIIIIKFRLLGSVGGQLILGIKSNMA